MKHKTLMLIAFLTCVAMRIVSAQSSVDLSGNWSFQLDDARAGERA